ncbi:MAG: lysine-2,3-aminomutase-like protein [Beijerinckiaceae bacterium]
MSPSKTLRSVSALAEAGYIPVRDAAALEVVSKEYAVAVTPALLKLINPLDPTDPIARQFLPSEHELVKLPIELSDPIGDNAHMPVEGVVHRYPDRVLLKIVHACPVYCRFCFRREMVGPGGDSLTGDKLEAALDYIAAHPEIWEVILTGGDPFILNARRVQELMQRLGKIPHVKVVRWHTRVPVVDPERVTAAFVKALKVPGKATYVAIHANHPREFTEQAQQAIARMADAGIVLLSQSVLLKGVNDNVETLADLMRSFVANRIKPYYLHHPDLAPGTSHFRLTVAEGQALVKQLRGTLSGLCQPEYVLDIPGGHGKSPLAIGYVTHTDDGLVVEDYRGVAHRVTESRTLQKD